MAGPLTVAGKRGVIRRYFEHLPVSDATPIVTLDEGDTPLIYSDSFSKEIGAEVWLKYEGLNPTGSFKDRGMTMAISKALEEGSSAVVCASTGNTSASAAAYAARAGMICAVLIPQGNVALGKLAQALVHGARVLEIEGNFDQALELTKEMAKTHPITLVNSVNPFRIEGQKTAAFEVVEALGRAPDLHVMPVGNAGNITAYWRGYQEARDLGWSESLPEMHGFQAEGANPIVRGEVVADPKTIATAIRIGNPASWKGATDAASVSGGGIYSIRDKEILEAYRSLAEEGIFVELASAAGVAGLRQMKQKGLVPEGATVACVLTGHGLKDPDWAIAGAPRPKLVRAEIGPILSELELA
ncbi:MAG: threonine synthase [Actinomycetota bacterium]|jgi:threonine synthase|nr:threonine synthase [Actinomycetota bacterium]